MINNYFTLQKLTAELAPLLRGRMLKKIISDRSHRIYFVLESGALIVNIGPGKKYMFLQPNMKKFPVPAYPLFKECAGRTLEDMSLLHGERVVCLTLDNGHRFLLFLYSPVENVLLLNDSISYYFEKKQDKFRDVYNIALHFAHNIVSSPHVDSMLNALSPLHQPRIKSELEHRLSRTPQKAQAVASFMRELNSPGGVLAWQRAEKIPVPLYFPFIPSLLDDNLETELIDSPNRAVQIVTGHARKATEFNRLFTTIEKGLKFRRRYLQKSVKDIHQQMRNREKRMQYIRQANLIKWNLHVIKKGVAEVKVPDYENDMKETVIRLNPRMEPEEFARRLYDKAKRLENMPDLEGRLQKLESKRNEVDDALNKLDAYSEIKPLKALHRQLLEQGLLETDFKGASRGHAERIPYREYRYGAFRYRVGKSAAESDYLTLKLSRKTDWFFHAQDIKGSHVVVSAIDGHRLERLPKDVIARAAVLAAYYSAAKNSQYVPVQYIQIRYIRKPRGAPSGTVVFNRYESVFAEPAQYGKLTFDV